MGKPKLTLVVYDSDNFKKLLKNSKTRNLLHNMFVGGFEKETLEYGLSLNDVWSPRKHYSDTPSYASKWVFVLLKVNKTIVGMCMLDKHKRYPGKLYLHGFVVGKKHRGKGYGTGLLKVLQKKLDKPLVAEVYEDNVASQRCFEKSGFEKVDEEYEPANGKYYFVYQLGG